MRLLNRIYCGDCLELFKTIPDSTVDMVITSPPYNVKKKYDIYTDEISWIEWYTLISKFLDESYRVLVDGGNIAVNVPPFIKWQIDHKFNDTWADFDKNYITHRDDRKINGRGRIEPVGFNIQRMMMERDPHIRESIVWVKGTENMAISSNSAMGNDSNPFMRGVHEIILIGSKNQWFHRGGTGRRGKDAVPKDDYTKDVWFVPASTVRIHPATFPIEIPRRLIKLFTHAPDSIILDPFCGIGTTCIAAKELRRYYIGFELSPHYCEIAQKTLEE